LPEPPNNPSLSPPPPESFEEANGVVQEAWKVAFPSLRFPLKLIGVFPSRKSQVVAAPHEVPTPAASSDAPINNQRLQQVKSCYQQESRKPTLERASFLKGAEGDGRPRTNRVDTSNPSPTGSIRGEPSPSLRDALGDIDSTGSISLPVGGAGASKL
jgi:hypothetical protein